MRPHERFAAWQHSHRLVVVVYQISRRWPREEMFGLIAQARRAAISAAANIAEGAAKRGSREFGRFLDIAIGSLAELSYLLFLARELGYLKEQEYEEVEALRDEAGRSVWGLYASIRRSTRRT